MKLRTRLISLLLAAVMVFSVFSLSGCNLIPGLGGDGTTEPDGDSGNPDGSDATLPSLLDPTDDNYRTFYQIFVGSFSDNNRDGIGDLRGIINRMDYLNDGDINNGNDLGVQGIWLSPIFTSPSYHKYDVKDYYKIDWRFGKMEDLKELADLCEERNVKLILDLVLNHTSNQNEWFVQFEQARRTGDTENKYYDYYTCVTAAEKVAGRSYQKIATVDAYYEINFSTDMPELNYDNPEVREEMLNVAKYYIDLGIDGFRFDAVKYIYYGDTPANVEFWEWYMSELRAYKPDIYCVGECWSGEGEILNYYSAMDCFNFAMSGAEGYAATAGKGRSLSTFLNYIESYQNKVEATREGAIPMQFLSNHDQDRIAGAFLSTNNMKMTASLYLLTPGSHFIYYGEEIGIRGSRGSAMTDANRRLAMLWGDGDRIRNPEGSTYKQENQIDTTVSDQLLDDTSLLAHYSKLINIRTKYPAIARGDYNTVTSTNSNLGGFYVEYEGEILGILHNNSANSITMDLTKLRGLDDHSLTEILEVIGYNATLDGTMLTIDGYTSIILK